MKLHTVIYRYKFKILMYITGFQAAMCYLLLSFLCEKYDLRTFQSNFKGIELGYLQNYKTSVSRK